MGEIEVSKTIVDSYNNELKITFQIIFGTIHSKIVSRKNSFPNATPTFQLGFTNQNTHDVVNTSHPLEKHPFPLTATNIQLLWIQKISLNINCTLLSKANCCLRKFYFIVWLSNANIYSPSSFVDYTRDMTRIHELYTQQPRIHKIDGKQIHTC